MREAADSRERTADTSPQSTDAQALLLLVRWLDGLVLDMRQGACLPQIVSAMRKAKSAAGPNLQPVSG